MRARVGRRSADQILCVSTTLTVLIGLCQKSDLFIVLSSSHIFTGTYVAVSTLLFCESLNTQGYNGPTKMTKNNTFTIY